MADLLKDLRKNKSSGKYDSPPKYDSGSSATTTGSVKRMASQVESNMRLSERKESRSPERRSSSVSVQDLRRAFNDSGVEVERLKVGTEPCEASFTHARSNPKSVQSTPSFPEALNHSSKDFSAIAATSIEDVMKRFESKQSFSENPRPDASDKPESEFGPSLIDSRIKNFAKSDSSLARDERDRVSRVKEHANMTSFNQDELERRRSKFLQRSDSLMRRGDGKQRVDSHTDDRYDTFQRKLSQFPLSKNSQTLSDGLAGSSTEDTSLDFANIADVVLDDSDEFEVDSLRSTMSRRVSTVGAGMHQYSFATSKHVAENLNQTNLRLETDDFAEVASMRSMQTLSHIVAQLDDDRTPMYFTLTALLNSINRSESCPLVLDVLKLEHPYEGMSTEAGFLALVFHKAKRHESALFLINPANEGDNRVSVRFVIPLWGKMGVHMAGDGHLTLTNYTSEESFEFQMPSVQSMRTATNALNTYINAAAKAKCEPNVEKTHRWLEFYDAFLQDPHLHANGSLDAGGSLVKVPSVMYKVQSLEEERNSEKLLTDLEDGEREATIIRAMKDILSGFRDDLDDVTFSMMYDELGKHFRLDIKQMFKPFIDEKLLMVLGQMESASEIYDGFLFLGTEWNASNKEELEERGCEYILNMTKEIDIFFPGNFHYMRRKLHDTPNDNIYVHLDAATDFIATAHTNNSRVLVHCQMGVSRSASAVIAYGMRAFGWSLEDAYAYVKRKRNVVKPNSGFWEQLKLYEQKLHDDWKRFGLPEFRPQPSDFCPP